MTKTKIVALLSVLALLASLPLTVTFAQGAPYLVIGTAMLDDELAMMGTLVVAMVGDEKVGSGEVFNEMGHYRLLITEGNVGDTVMISLMMGEGDEMMEYLASTDGDVMIGAPGEVKVVDLMAYSSVLALSIRPAVAVPGQQILIEGSGFVAGDEISSVSIGNQTASVYATADSAGDIVFAVNVPSSPRGPGIGFGKKTVSVTATGSGRVAEGSIEIPKAAITLDPMKSRRGSTVRVSGSGFPSGDLVQVKYDNDGTFVTVAASSADASGAVSMYFTVPSYANIGSKHNIEATSVGVYKSVTANATHETPAAMVTLSSDTISSGENITITGRNFPAFATVAVMVIGGIDVRPVPAPATSIHGDFESTVLVPLLEPGIHTVSVRVGGTTVSTFLEIDTSVPVPPAGETPDATVTLSSDTVSSGEHITITGRNFPAFVTVAVIEIGGVDVRPVPTPATSVDGYFESTVLVPELELGFQTVWVRVGQTTVTTFLEIVPATSVPQANDHSATRSFSETTVAPGAEITVNIALSEYGRGGSVTETLPEGFSFVSGSIEFVGGEGFARPSGNQVGVVLAGAGVTNVIYKVTAPSEAGGPFEFTGTFVNFDGESVDIGGASAVTVAAEAGTPASYDSNGNGTIELPELFDAIDEYFAGEISLTVLFDIIDFYFSGDRVG